MCHTTIAIYDTVIFFTVVITSHLQEMYASCYLHNFFNCWNYSLCCKSNDWVVVVVMRGGNCYNH